MSTSDGYTIVIPARYGSSRFPGKMLVPLDGRALVLHALDRARESDADEIIVATDDDRIADACRTDGAEVELTEASHPSGTDRIAEVARRRAWPADRRVLGLQGDEPATPAARLDALAESLHVHSEADMATLARPIRDADDYRSPDRVKVVRDARGFALYFSRAPIPWRRDPEPGSSHPDAWLHVGLYAYRAGFLARYAALAPSPLEDEEKLEQLRVLHHGGRIHVGALADDDLDAPGVDRPEDMAPALAAVRALRAGSSMTGPT